MASISDSDDDLLLLDGDDEEAMAVLAVLQAATSSTELLFSSGEMIAIDQRFVDRTVGVRDQLSMLLRMPSLFHTMTNFSIDEFDELCGKVCPLIDFNARHTGEPRHPAGRPPKLRPEQRLLAFLLFLKHDNTSVFDGSLWNWSKTSQNDDSIFVGSCIVTGIDDEIQWPSASERRSLAARIPASLLRLLLELPVSSSVKVCRRRSFMVSSLKMGSGYISL